MTRPHLTPAWRRVWLLALLNAMLLVAGTVAATALAVRDNHVTRSAEVGPFVGVLSVVLAVGLGLLAIVMLQVAYAVRLGRLPALARFGGVAVGVAVVVAMSFLRSRPPVSVALLALAGFEGWATLRAARRAPLV